MHRRTWAASHMYNIQNQEFRGETLQIQYSHEVEKSLFNKDKEICNSSFGLNILTSQMVDFT